MMITDTNCEDYILSKHLLHYIEFYEWHSMPDWYFSHVSLYPARGIFTPYLYTNSVRAIGAMIKLWTVQNIW